MNRPEFVAEEDAPQDNFLAHLPIIMLERRWLVIAPLIVCSIVGIAAAFLLPPRYVSRATLLVESQALPADVLGAPLTSLIDQRIARIRQQILSRPDLTEIILANNLYADERQSKPLSTIITNMRDAVTIAAVDADIAASNQRGGTSSTVAFALSFTYPEAAPAQAVTQEFVDRLLRLDQTQVTEQAEGTVEFLEEQSQTLQGQIGAIEGEIRGIKARNGMALSSAGSIGTINMGGYESQIMAIQRENSELVQQAQAVQSRRDPIVEQAEIALASAQASYADSHPDVRAAQQRLTQARALAAKNPAPNSNGIRAQIGANNAMIGQLNAQRQADLARTNATMSAQATAPLILEQVSQLEERAEGLRENYRRIAANLLNARSSARMESEQKGERLSVIDPPVVPDKPNSPNRPVLALGGIAAGLAIGVALALAMELFLRPIRGVGALTGLLGVAPLVVIPTMHAPKPVRARRRWFGRRRKAQLA